MTGPLARVTWCLLLSRVALGVLVGVMMLVLPASGLLLLPLFWCFYAPVDGLAMLVTGLLLRGRPERGLLVAGGLVSLLALLPVFVPLPDLLFLNVHVVALWMVLSGSVHAVAAIALRGRGQAAWRWLLGYGVSGALFGVLLAAQTQVISAPSVVQWVVFLAGGAYAVVAGAVVLVWGSRVRNAEGALAAA